MRRLAALLAAMMLAGAASANVRLPHVISSHMVLQRDKELPIWGWADPGEAVSVTFGDQAAVTATTAADGTWQVKLPAQKAGGPFNLTVKGANQIVVDDVLVGEVWLCSGQSNMEFQVQSCQNVKPDIDAADLPMIRQFHLPYIPAGAPVADRDSSWQVCSPQTVGGFTACGFFMARKLAKDLGVPVGLVHSSWGGTRIEPWCTPESFAEVPGLEGLANDVALADVTSDKHHAAIADYAAKLEAWRAKHPDKLAKSAIADPPPALPGGLTPMNQRPDANQQPTTLYCGMIAPIVPYAIRGAIWYQGESNHGEGPLYTLKMQALIQGWRKVFGVGDFQFLFVQIAPFNYGGEVENTMPEFWEAQAAVLSKVPSTGMVVTNDVATYNNIHPPNKQEVGRRLALLALKGSYGKTDTVADGPVFKSLATEGDTLRVTFDNAAGGLTTRDGKAPDWFQIVGEDVDWTPATATIDGESVLLKADGVSKPAAVRFGWSKRAEMNLSNKDGLPARPFRAGTVPRRDWLAMKVAEAKSYALVYDLDLAKLAHDITYDVDNHATVTGPIDRIGYFVELTNGGSTQWLWVSMDAFTQDLTKVGIPTLASKATWQQKVANANILSNVAGIVNGEGIATCNMEFWPNNYGPGNAAGIPGASDTLYDWGDQITDPVDGYGSMQVHNYGAKQTLFAINHWAAGSGADLGIGNNPNKANGQNPDWTFAANAGAYSAKRLRVLVHRKP
jgi:sialate O-acetylesterase